ncbi:BMP family lipoprotein [Caldalkalibacillus mannanilyticus]|uniref:BMP family lipoprotein n=1 Tax=Caldalkalibacillus mannanilyticus TaxID=1418 RepID=UPI00046A00B5|nr:BMP family ABC transporter substrate-binding protein [Caldalkalibacillus mannanilyticus]
MQHRFRLYFLIIVFIVATTLGGCTSAEKNISTEDSFTVGVMLSDTGLGDQSFSDLAFNGLERARDELGILFDYRELHDSETYEQGLKELVLEGHDVVVGLGFMIQEPLEIVAKEFPEQKFLLIDSVSDLDNITSITFKEDEGSYLAGVVAALTTQTKTVGFIGGADVPVINKFATGFVQGVKSVDPDINIYIEYAGSFSDDQLGGKLADEMITKQADVLYSAAGFTGVGVLQKAEQRNVYAIGVDSDQYFYAEKAVITSMMKNIDVSIYNLIKEYLETKTIPSGHIELGLKEEGVGLAPLRLIDSVRELEQKIEQATQHITNR